jgi:hypothetical protein
MDQQLISLDISGFEKPERLQLPAFVSSNAGICFGHFIMTIAKFRTM